MAEFAQRPMVTQGLPPSAPDAVGTGITSGLVPENDDPIIQQGLEQFASSVEGLYGKLDQAESLEDVMNSVRGNEVPKKERVAELAEMVGEKDAKKTPDSVLAVMQPYFQILEMVQSQASDVAPGGIANAPMAGGGQPNVNFNQASPIQAPGSEEAMMRIAMGETPVGFSHGGYHDPITGKPSVRPTTLNQPQMLPSPFADTDYLSNTPKFASVDFGNIEAGTNRFMDVLTPYAKTGTTDPKTLMAKREGLLSSMLVDPRNKEEILAEQQEFFGGQDQTNMETQASLALAKFGAQIANSPGSLLQAMTGNTSEFAGDLSKVAAQKAKLDRDSKEFAYGTAQQEKNQLEAQKLSIAMGSIDQAAKNETDFNNLLFTARRISLEKGVDLEKTQVAALNVKLAQSFAANNQYGTLATETWGKVAEDGTVDVIGARRTDTGMKKFDDGTFSKIPEGYAPMTAAQIAAYQAAGKIDYSTASAKTLMIPDSTTSSGLREVAGIFYNGRYLLSKSGNQVDIDGKPDFVPAPNGFIVGNKDLFSTSTDTVGRTTVTFKRGPREGETIMTKLVNQGDAIYDTELEMVDGQLVEKINPDTGQPIIKLGPNGRPIVLVAEGASVSVNPQYRQVAPEYNYFDAAGVQVDTPVSGGSQTYVKGNPLVKNLGPIGVDPDRLAPNEYALQQRKILSLNQALNQADEIINSVFSSVGPVNSVKSFVSNAFGGFTNQDMDKALLDYSKQSRGNQNLQMFGRALARALALSDRYAVAEQKLIQELAIEPGGFFKSSKMSAVRFKELARILQNDLNYSVATLNGEDYNETQSIPEGTTNDPFIYSGFGQFDYLKVASANGADFDGKFLVMSNQEAQTAFPNNREFWGAGGPVTLKIGTDIVID